MIRINLLPVREAKRQAGLKRQGIFLGIGAAAGVALSVCLNVAVTTQARAKEAAIREAQAELTKLQATRKEVEKYRAEKEEIERKLNVINQLERSRTGQVRILDEIATKIPDRMWLSELSLENGRMTMTGVSIDAEIVAEFMTLLADSERISDVELEETTVKQQEGLMLNVFKIQGRYGGGAPPDTGTAPPAAARGRGR